VGTAVRQAWGDVGPDVGPWGTDAYIEFFTATIVNRNTRVAPNQTSLGNAYAQLPGGDRIANLQKAIDFHEAALRVCIEKDFPLNWALNQTSLGNTYAQLLTGDRPNDCPKKLVESAFPLRSQTWKLTFCSWTRKPNSYP